MRRLFLLAPALFVTLALFTYSGNHAVGQQPLDTTLPSWARELTMFNGLGGQAVYVYHNFDDNGFFRLTGIQVLQNALTIKDPPPLPPKFELIISGWDTSNMNGTPLFSFNVQNIQIAKDSHLIPLGSTTSPTQFRTALNEALKPLLVFSERHNRKPTAQIWLQATYVAGKDTYSTGPLPLCFLHRK